MKYKFLILIIALFCFTTKKAAAQNNTSVDLWKGIIVRSDSVNIPFNFEVQKNSNKTVITILNGKERFLVEDIQEIKDSIKIVLPLFDSEIRAIKNLNRWEGNWIRTDGNNLLSMKFIAKADSTERFIANKKPAFNISGKWDTYFGIEKKYAIGEFYQENEKLYGTFLTKSGDYRYLEGIVDGSNFSLSTFDGSHAFLFEGTITSDSTLDGKFYPANAKPIIFSSKKNNQASLPDSYSLTQLKENIKTLNFSFPDIDKNLVSLQDDRFKNKVVLIQILGSWCPNCIDEIAYLSSLYNNQKTKNIEIIGLAYERTKDFEKSRNSLMKVKERFDVNYPLLITGFTNDKGEVLSSLNNLKNFSAFPTLIIINKKGEVDKIHTGFNGPGTGQHYDEFKQEFENYISNLLKQ